MGEEDKPIGIARDNANDEKYNQKTIWDELKMVFHHKDDKGNKSEGKITSGSRCPDKAIPLCRVQERIYQKDMFERAKRLNVPPTGNIWFYGAMLFCLTVAIVTFLIVYVINVMRGSYGSLWNPSQILAESMGPISGFIVLFFAWLILIAMIQAAKKFEFKVYIPVPDTDEASSTEGGKLKWNYYLSTALPMSDVDTISAEGSKKNGKIASQTVSPYQGAYNIGQLKVKVKSALTDLVSRFASKKSSNPTPAVDARLLTNAAKDIYASRSSFKQFNEIASKNGITVESLTELSSKDDKKVFKYPEIGELAAVTLTYADKVELPQNGPVPPDELWRNDMKVLLTIENPKLKAASERYDSALLNMTGLGARLEPAATAMGFLNDDQMGTAVKSALSKVIVDTSEDSTRIKAAAKAMIDKDMVQVDSLVGFTATAMDDLLVPYMSKNADFNQAVWKRVISCVAILAAMWLLWYLIKAYKNPNMKSLIEQLNNIGTSKVYDADGEFLPEAERAYQRAKVYNNGMAFVASMLTGVMKYVVLAMVITAVCITYYNNSVRYYIALREEQEMLETITSVLRKMDSLRCTSLLKNGSQDQLEYVEGIKQIEACLNMNILSDGNASARGQYPIAEMVTYIVMATAAAVLIIIIAKRMMPKETYSHMKDLHARAQVGGGEDVMPVDQSAYLDSMIVEGVPADIRATIVLISLISICYYFVKMIKDAALYKGDLSSQSIIKSMNNTVNKVSNSTIKTFGYH